MEIAISARLLNWYSMAWMSEIIQKINESNFIGEIDEVWIGDYAEWYKIVEFWGDAIIWHGKLYSRLHLKVIHGYYIRCVYKILFLWLIVKWLLLTVVSILHM